MFTSRSEEIEKVSGECILHFLLQWLFGIWHGASFNFLLWGIVHGIILILHRILSGTRQNIQLKERFYKNTFSHFMVCNTVFGFPLHG